MRRRLVIWAGLLVVLVVAGATGWLYLRAPAEDEVPRTIKVARGSVEETVLASGIIEASSLVSVGAEVTGRIKKLDVELGQDVKAGDTIAEIDSTNQENAVKSAEAQLAQIQAQKKQQDASLASAQVSLTRAQQLSPNKLVSDADLQTAKLAVQTAEAQQEGLDAQIQQSEIAVDTAKLNLSRTTIVAPSAGTVVAVLVDEGQTVNAQSSAPTIVKIANLDNMVVKAEVSEADVPRVQPGQKVYFTILGAPNDRIEATLRSIEPAPDSIDSDTTASSSNSAVYYNALFDVPNPDHRLRISMTAQVTIVLDSADNVLTVPAAVLGRKDRNGNYRVAVWNDATGKPDVREVKVGLNNNILAEVVDGLDEGDQVVAGTAFAAGGPGGAGGPPGAGNNRGRPPAGGIFAGPRPF